MFITILKKDTQKAYLFKHLIKNHNMEKSILITGASSGIGKYVSIMLAKRGWIVWAGCRTKAEQGELKKINPKKIFPVILDVTIPTQIKATERLISKSNIPLNAVFNNAGLALAGPLEMVEIKEIKRLYEVNFFGVINVIQTFLPLLRKNSGRIINMSSISGLISIPLMIPYCSSKFAIESLSDGLRRELNAQDIKVSIIEAGSINTPIWDKTFAWSEKSLKDMPKIKIIYKDSLKNIMQKAKGQKFLSIESLKKPIIHALESSKPKKRYLIYKNGFLVKILLKTLPAIILGGGKKRKI